MRMLRSRLGLPVFEVVFLAVFLISIAAAIAQRYIETAGFLLALAIDYLSNLL